MSVLKFKMFRQGKHCGFEKHEIIDEGVNIFHSADGKDWYPITKIGVLWICHDEKRLFTGYFDKKGKEIYIGDFLCETDDSLLLQVGMIEGWKLGAAPVGSPSIFYAAYEFKDLLLVEAAG